MARAEYLYVPEGLAHETGLNHPECPSRLRAIAKAFEEAGIRSALQDFEEATREDILRVHSAEHYDAIENICATLRPYPYDSDTTMGTGSWCAALTAAGCVIGACKRVVGGQADRVFCAIRPPGHHALHDHAMGFCLFNNVAIAARWLQAKGGIKRVAIVDWDVHHGNGTQNTFYEDDTVFYASIHQFPHYPGTGHPNERGKNNTTLNVAMPPNSEPGLWLKAMEDSVVPALKAFNPEFLLVSAGFDAHRLDPLGNQRLEDEHFAALTRKLFAIAKGKMVSSLEGGYNLSVVGGSALAHFKAMQE